MSSAFTVCDPNSYEIITCDRCVISNSPVPSLQTVSKSPKPVKVMVQKKKKTKKFWSNEQKNYALEVARELGLSKGARFLQATDPSSFGDLSTSTLQYWIQTRMNKTH